MRYLYTILFAFSFLITNATNILSNRDSSIYVVKGNIQRFDDELIVSFELSVSRDLLSNESVVLEPIVLDSLGREETLPKIYINSRRQHIMVQRGFYNDVDPSNMLLRERGTVQSFHYLESVPYSNWMESAMLVVNEESCGCGLPLSSDIAFVAEVRNPFLLPAKLPNLAYIVPEETDLKIRNDEGRAYIIFPLNDTIVHPNFGNNKVELDKIINSIDIVKNDPNCLLKEVSIHGYASPEGAYSINDRLSRGRSNSIKEYVYSLYDFPEKLFKSQHTAEDWDGFESLLEHSSHRNKAEILKIVRSNIALDKKEHKIRSRYPQFFKMLLDDWFITLRHTDYTIKYEICFFNTIEEIESMYTTNPKNLSLNELFQLYQSYASGSEQRNNVLLQSVLLYPDDPIANLNAACAALNRRDVVAAKQYLGRSLDCGERDLALGLYYLLIEEYDSAGIYFKLAEERGVEESKAYIDLYNSITNW